MADAVTLDPVDLCEPPRANVDVDYGCETVRVSRGRLEAFSDGALAVLITIMVLDLRPPAGHEFSDLRPLLPKVLVYALSFAFLAIYWNNHHHLMHVVEHISGAVLWANAHLLFWLSLTPAATAWLGPHVHDHAPVLVYGVVLFGSAVAYFVLTRTLLSIHAPDSPLARAIGADWKGRLSAAACLVAIAAAFVQPWISIAIYVAVAIVWLIPTAVSSASHLLRPSATSSNDPARRAPYLLLRARGAKRSGVNARVCAG